MKRMLALAVACALVLEGCGESDAPGEARKKTVLEYASMKDIRNINPHLYLGEMAAQAMVFEPLVFNTPEGVKPALAERWEISGDGRTYTFHLRRGVKFTDGTPFTADAVKKNIDAVMANYSSRYDNTIAYVSPEFAGVTIYAQYAMGDTNENKVSNDRYAALGAE